MRSYFNKIFRSSTSTLEYVTAALPVFAIIMVVFCTLALLMIAVEIINRPFVFTPQGFLVFLKLFEPYSVLFSSTLALILAIEAFKRLRLMEEANRNTFRASNRTIWIQTIKEFFSDEIKKEDPGVFSVINRNILSLHDFLFDRNYIIEKKEDTIKMFNVFFKDQIEFMERNNSKFRRISCYPNLEKSFSWYNFRFLIGVMLTNGVYQNFWQDLQSLYQQKVVEFINQSSQMVDINTHQDELVKLNAANMEL